MRNSLKFISKYSRRFENWWISKFYQISDKEKLDTLRPCKLTSAWVFGSAPNPTPLYDEVQSAYFVCVNASFLSSRQITNRIPDLTVFNADLIYQNKPANLDARPFLEEIKTNRVLFLEDRIVSRKISKILNSYLDLVKIKKATRDLIVGEMTNNQCNNTVENKISTGMFAILLMCYLGYSPIYVSGFSLSQDGHSYNRYQRPRSHKESDEKALYLLRRAGFDIRLL